MCLCLEGVPNNTNGLEALRYKWHPCTTYSQGTVPCSSCDNTHDDNTPNMPVSRQQLSHVVSQYVVSVLRRTVAHPR